MSDGFMLDVNKFCEQYRNKYPLAADPSVAYPRMARYMNYAGMMCDFTERVLYALADGKGKCNLADIPGYNDISSRIDFEKGEDPVGLINFLAHSFIASVFTPDSLMAEISVKTTEYCTAHKIDPVKLLKDAKDYRDKHPDDDLSYMRFYPCVFFGPEFYTEGTREFRRNVIDHSGLEETIVLKSKAAAAIGHALLATSKFKLQGENYDKVIAMLKDAFDSMVDQGIPMHKIVQAHRNFIGQDEIDTLFAMHSNVLLLVNQGLIKQEKLEAITDMMESAMGESANI
jgi:hypothetical protein